MNLGYFWVFWRIFFGYTGLPLPPLADPDCCFCRFIFLKQWIPALNEGRLSLGEFLLPVSLEKLPSSYSMLSTEVTE